MFVLGKLAERFPHVVKEIQADGHEVACHGYGHVEIAQLSPDEFLSDLRRAKDLLGTDHWRESQRVSGA